MKKVLIIIPENNKGKFISKGFSAAFKKLSFFTYDMKIYDLNKDVINKIAPDIIFTFWTGIKEKNQIKQLFEEITVKPDFIHCAEYFEDIPDVFFEKKCHFTFYSNSKNKKNKYIQPVSASDYKSTFNGYRYSITFAGNPADKAREEILTELVRNFGVINIFCRSFDFYKSLDDISEQKLLDEYEVTLYKKSYKGYVDSTKELADIFVSSKVNIDCPSKFRDKSKGCERNLGVVTLKSEHFAGGDDTVAECETRLDIQNQNSKEINYRLLEITASGAFIIAPYSKIVIKQYDNGKDIETYRNIEELTDKIEFYLKNIGLAQLIALNGKKNTISNFSYYDKLKNILKGIYGKDFSSR